MNTRAARLCIADLKVPGQPDDGCPHQEPLLARLEDADADAHLFDGDPGRAPAESSTVWAVHAHVRGAGREPPLEAQGDLAHSVAG